MRIFGSFYVLIAVSGCLGLLGLSGCSDNPRNAAAREIRNSTRQALQLVQEHQDYAQAREMIQKAVRGQNATLAEDAVSQAYLTSGEIAYLGAARFQGQIPELEAVLDGMTEQVQAGPESDDLLAFVRNASRTLNKISANIRKMNALQIEKERIRMFQNVKDVNIEQYQTKDPGGLNWLREELAKTQRELAGLEQEREKLKDQFDVMRENSATIEDQVEQLLTRADRLEGDERLAVEKQAFEMMAGRKNIIQRQQNAADRLKVLGSQIAVVEPMVGKIKSQIEEVEQKIAQLSDRQKRTEQQNLITDIDGQIENINAHIQTYVDQIVAAEEGYNTMIARAQGLLEDAVSDFNKVRARGMRSSAKNKLANAEYLSALIYDQAFRFELLLSRRIDSILEEASDQDRPALRTFLDTVQENQEHYSRQALEKYGTAAEAMAQAAAASRNACPLIQAQILALLGRQQVAELLMDYELASSIDQEIAPLAAEAQECDPQWETSVAARVMREELQYTPTIPVDEGTYFAQKREEFEQLIAQLPGDEEQRIAAIQILLDQLAELETQARNQEAFISELGPIQTELRAKLEEPAEPAEDFFAQTDDPNAF